MRVHLRHPRRVEEVTGPCTVRKLLDRLSLIPESVLVIRDGELLLAGDRLEDTDEVELRPVISGG